MWFQCFCTMHRWSDTAASTSAICFGKWPIGFSFIGHYTLYSTQFIFSPNRSKLRNNISFTCLNPKWIKNNFELSSTTRFTIFNANHDTFSVFHCRFKRKIVTNCRSCLSRAVHCNWRQAHHSSQERTAVDKDFK